METSGLRKSLRAFKGLFGSYKRAFAVLVVLGILGGLLESLGVSVLIPLFAHILQQPLPEGTSFIVDAFNWFFDITGLDLRLRVLLPLVFIAFALRAVVQWAFEYVRTSITTDYERNLRRDLYRKFLNAEWSFLVKQKLGHTENDIMLGVSTTTRLFGGFANSILNITTLAAYVVVAMAISVEITLATLLIGGVVLFVFRPFLRRTRKYGGAMLSMGKQLAHDINERVVGLKSIKANGRERAVAESMYEIFDKFRLVRLQQTMSRAVTTAAIQPITVLFIGLVFVYAFNRPGFELSSFIVIIFLIQRIFLYVDRAQATLHEMNQQIPFASSVMKFMAEFDAHKETSRGTKPFSFTNKITFENVTFNYRPKNVVLKGIDVTINHGETVGIIGPSGAGKTTVADLLLRLLRPASGAITVDGIPLEEISLEDWRENVAYVSQEFFLLNDTIFANVRFYDEHITEADVHDAIKSVGLTDVVAALPQGIHTVVGERGLDLSAGQRQRIALARALVRDPDILVLDEATSALDGESEQAIHEALQALHGTMTMVIIAHRLTTVMETDKVVVIEKGKIAEEGSPQELLKDENSYFYRLTHLQE
jgi:ABC-type multidrug transport system fused ATPase/permease subunit